MSTLHPWQFFLISVAGWINRHQQEVIDYLVEENRILKGQLRGRRVREVSRGTIANILKENGIEPAHERSKRTPWRTFLKAHWMIFFGEESLRRAISEFVAHYHRERHHQGLGNRLIDPEDSGGATAGEVHCRERLGGMLRYYYRAAA